MNKSISLVVACFAVVVLLSSISVVSAFSLNGWLQNAFGKITGHGTAVDAGSTGLIKIMVQDSVAGSTVKSATVTMKTSAGASYNAVYDGNFFYIFSAIPVATYTLTVSADGYTTYTQTSVAIKGGDNNGILVSLVKSSASTGSSGSGSGETTTPSTGTSSCSDSDKGLDYYTKGVIAGEALFSETASGSDVTIHSPTEATVLYESAGKSAVSVRLKLGESFSFDGNKGTLKSIDTANQKVVLEYNSLVDSCNGNHVLERSCSEKGDHVTSFFCPNGCKEGACVDIPPAPEPPKGTTPVTGVSDRDSINLGTSARKIYFQEPINSGLSALTSSELPNLLSDGKVIGVDGAVYSYNQKISLGTTKVTFGTSQGDLADPIIYLDVGTDSIQNPLYTYSLTFSRSINLADENVKGQRIIILEREYIIGKNSRTNVLYLSPVDSPQDTLLLTDGVSVREGTNENTIKGTMVDLISDNSGSLSGFSVKVAMGSSKEDHLAVRESFRDPVFGNVGNVYTYFDSVHPDFRDSNLDQDIVEVSTDNEQFAYVAFTPAGATKSQKIAFAYDTNPSTQAVDLALAHQKIGSRLNGYIRDKNGAGSLALVNDWMIVPISSEDAVILEVTDISVDSSTLGSVTLQNVLTGESQKISLQKDGDRYVKKGVNFFGGTGYTIEVDSQGSTVMVTPSVASNKLSPKIELQHGNAIAMGILSDLKVAYNLDLSGFRDADLSFALKSPAIAIFEKKKLSDGMKDVIVVPLTKVGSFEIGVGDPFIVKDGKASSLDYVTLNSDTYKKQAVDAFGTLVTKEDRTNYNGVATLSLPSSQMYFDISISGSPVAGKGSKPAPVTPIPSDVYKVFYDPKEGSNDPFPLPVQLPNGWSVSLSGGCGKAGSGPAVFTFYESDSNIARVIKEVRVGDGVDVREGEKFSVDYAASSLTFSASTPCSQNFAMLMLIKGDESTVPLPGETDNYIIPHDFGSIVYEGSESGKKSDLVDSLASWLKGFVDGADARYGMTYPPSDSTAQLQVAVAEYDHQISFNDIGTTITNKIKGDAGGKDVEVSYYDANSKDILLGDTGSSPGSRYAIYYNKQSSEAAVVWTSGNKVVIFFVENVHALDEQSNSDGFRSLWQAYLKKYPSTLVPASCDNGCVLSTNLKCVPYGFRSGDQFCGLDNAFVSQLQTDMTCDNSYECSSNVCVSNQCVDANLFQKIINFFKRGFGTQSTTSSEGNKFAASLRANAAAKPIAS